MAALTDGFLELCVECFTSDNNIISLCEKIIGIKGDGGVKSKGAENFWRNNRQNS